MGGGEDRLALELEFAARGFRTIAGVDEVGRGALFGPVVCAAVVLREGPDLLLYRDSKTLSESRRERLFEQLCADGHAWAVGEVSAEEIDHTDILRSTLKAMALAIEALPRSPDLVLVDGTHRPLITCACEAFIGGDARSASIAAASIVAKVHRDRMVRAFDRVYPGYGLCRNKGYGTAEHFAAVRRMGPTPLHRRTFRGVVTES